jgi:Flavodoxin-like fold
LPRPPPARIRATLERRGIEVDMIDLYADDFDPRLTGAERRGYFTTPYDSKAVAGYVARLRLAEKLVFVFPQWWFPIRHGPNDRAARRHLPRPPRTGLPALLTWRPRRCAGSKTIAEIPALS